MISLPVILSLLGAAGGLGSLLLVFPQTRKLKADAAQVVTSAASTMINELQEEVRELRVELKAAKAEATDARAELAKLHGELSRWRTGELRFVG